MASIRIACSPMYVFILVSTPVEVLSVFRGAADVVAEVQPLLRLADGCGLCSSQS